MTVARQPAGTPHGGRFAPSVRAEPEASISPTGWGYPEGPLEPRTFDIDGEFGPLAGYDDSRRWNGFAAPWLTEDSLRVVRDATKQWAQISSEVEWLDDGPDGIWRLHTCDGEPVELERAASPGPGGEVLHRLEGWCWETSDVTEEHPQP